MLVTQVREFAHIRLAQDRSLLLQIAETGSVSQLDLKFGCLPKSNTGFERGRDGEFSTR